MPTLKLATSLNQKPFEEFIILCSDCKVFQIDGDCYYHDYYMQMYIAPSCIVDC